MKTFTRQGGKVLKKTSGRGPLLLKTDTSGQNHISRCPGVTYWFSGRSLMDKWGQAIQRMQARTLGNRFENGGPPTLRLTAWGCKILNALSSVASGCGDSEISAPQLGYCGLQIGSCFSRRLQPRNQRKASLGRKEIPSANPRCVLLAGKIKIPKIGRDFCALC